MPNCIQFPPFRKNTDPEFFRMTCPKCGFDKKYELTKDYTGIPGADNEDSDYEITGKLPEVCPRCGAGLNREKLPRGIFH